MSDIAEVVLEESASVSEVYPPKYAKNLDALIERACNGDSSCQPEVRVLLADPNQGPHIVEHVGSSAKWLRQAIAGKAAGNNVLVLEAVRQKIDKVQLDLEGPNPSPIERLLAERAALSWFVVNYYEECLMNAGNSSLSLAEFSQRRIDRAHKRFLSAVETLARVRKLATPSLMVNVARKHQVNAAGY